MRFARLDMERYGRFEDCRLEFRSGEPDLHVVFGANEAGKSTTLAAVSDLLFGFPARSPFNFRFDYPLLRVGAVLEDEGRTFACRRRKAQAQTLVDAHDQPMDEGPLLAMLRGQDRERFRLGFSLDQARLREGGRAMVEAKDDLGQALFAAGSGMTGVAAVLSALEAEADAVWGRRASSRRFYTLAERAHDDAQRRVRELQLKPKAWTDAQAARQSTNEALSALQREHAELTATRRKTERLRRIGPDVRRRTELLEALAAQPGGIRLSAVAELSAQTALGELETASRAIASASELLQELDARIAALVPDAVVLAAADDLEALSRRAGSEEKAANDVARLRAELALMRTREAQLRAEVGGGASAVPRLATARLRELAARHGRAATALKTLQASIADAQHQTGPLKSAVVDAQVVEGLSELARGVDGARALGADIDDRCAAQAVALERLEEQVRASLAALAPWTGPVEALAALPPVAAEEVEAAQATAVRAKDAAETARLARESGAVQAEALSIRRRGLAEGGQAVPAERIFKSRDARDRAWTELREHWLGGVTLTDPAARAHAFETSVREADAMADQRFALAEASGRIAALDLQADEVALAAAQAERARNQAEAQGETAARAWIDRLTGAGLPPLPPLRLRAWLEARDAALLAHDGAERARAAHAVDVARRGGARTRLAALLPGEAPAEGEALSPLLEVAERRRAEGEARNQAFATGRANLRALESQLDMLGRQAGRAETDRAACLEEWEGERATLGLDLPVDGAEAWLQILDELRTLGDAADVLQTRIDGIERDAEAFASAVDALADALRESADTDGEKRLAALRARLAAARSVADAVSTLQTSRRARQDALRTGEADRDAALASLATGMTELGVTEVSALPSALEASREMRQWREALEQAEDRIVAAGDGYAVDALVAAFALEDPDTLAGQLQALDASLAALDLRIAEAAEAGGAARRSFEALETGPAAADAAAEAAQARAEMDAQAETYLLKRAQAVTLRWVVERYREQRQNPMLARASALFSTLTLGRYRELKIDHDAAPPRLLGLCENGASLVEVDHMSEGTSDQLFLALRLAAVEQALAAGVRLPFLADDLFVNFDDARARAGLQVLAELARSTQVLVFTHHTHLSALAREAVGADILSECTLE